MNKINTTLVVLGLFLSFAVCGQTTILTENFGASGCAQPSGWTNTGGIQFEFSTTDPGRGPGGDNTTGAGCYAQMDDSDANGTRRLCTPVMDLTGTNPELSFYIFNNDGSVGSNPNYSTLTLQASTDGGSSFSTIDIFGDNQPAEDYMAWTQITTSLSAYISATTVICFDGDEGASFESDLCLDDILIVSNCAPPTATYTVVPDCANAQFSVDVNVTALGDGTAVDITNDGGAAAINNVTTGTQTVGPFAAGTSVVITVDGSAYGGCAAPVSAAQTEACDCTTNPTATVASANLNCTTSMYDVQVTVTSDGSGDANMTDILIDGAVVQANATTNTLYTFNVATGMHAVEIQAEGASFVTCEAMYSTNETCNGSDDFSTSAPNILGTCSVGDLSVATAGMAQGFTGGCNDNLGVGGSTGNNVIRDCSNANFNNNTNWVDVWYQVDLPDGTDELTIDLTGLSTGEIVGFSLHTGDPGTDASNTQVFSANSDDCSFFDENITSQTITGLAAASTAPIYIRILSIAFDDGAGCGAIVNPTFQICASAPQPNDICGNAIDITTNNGGAASTGSLASASSENTGNEVETDCGGTTLASDLWYKVSTPNSASASDMFRIEYTVDGGNTGDVVVAKLYGPGCFASLIDCQELTFASPVTTIFNNALLSRNQEYYIQLMPKSGTLNNVTSSAIVAPENNICDQFNETFPGYDLADGSAVLDFSLATDTDGDGLKDLWYQINHSSNQDITLSITNTDWDGEVSLTLYDYDALGSNVDCNNLVEYCALSNIDDFDLESGELFNLGTGDYLLKVQETTPDSGGDQLSVTLSGVLSTITIASNASCANALDITNGSQTGNLTRGQLACPQTGLQNCDGNPIQSTSFDPFYASTLWYQFTVPGDNCPDLVTSSIINQATISFSGLTTNSGAGTKNVYVQIHDACGGTILDCGTANNGSSYTASGLAQGQTYLVEVINNTLSSTGTSDFTINQVTFPNPAPCNDDPADAEALTVNSSLNYPSLDTWSAGGATETAPVSGAPETDVWFSFVAPDPANGGSYTTAASWVTVFFESVSGEQLTLELYNTMTSEAPGTSAETISGAGGQQWSQFGNLTPGQTYYLRLYHKELSSVNVQYKIGITTGTGIEPGWGCGTNTYSNASGYSAGCDDLREQWFKIDLPDGTPGNAYWVIEVFGYDEWLDFELRSKYLMGNAAYDACSGVEAATEGTCADFDHPCSSAALESAVSITSTTALTFASDLIVSSAPSSCDDNTTPGQEGRGVRRVYFNMNGAAAGQKDYYYLRVFMDPSSPNYATATDINICQLNFAGPYSDETTANAGGAPDLNCLTACAVSNVALNTDGTCSGNNATFSIDFDITDGSGDYEIYATAANATYGIAVGDVLGTMTGAATTATGLTITGTVTGPTTAAESISVDIRDTNNNTCNGGTPITVNIPICNITCAANAGSLPTDPMGCQAVTNDIGGTTGLNLSSFGYNNTTAYTQVYYITDGTNVIEAISVVGTGTTPVAATSALTNYMAGTYDVYVVNYDNTDAAASAAVAGLTTVTNIMAVATTYSSGACMVRAANAMTIEVCDPVCACSEGTTGLVQGLTAVPGSYNPSTDYEQTYLLVDNAGVILDIQATANFTGLAAGTYQVYNLNYNTTAGESPLADGATWTAIDLGTTTIANLSTTPGLADACFDLVAPSGTITVDACPTATIVSSDAPICNTEDADFIVNGTNGTTLTYTITGQTGNQTLALTGVDQTITAAGATADVILTFVSVEDAGTPICTINLTNTATVTVNTCTTCDVNAGSLPTDPMGCQAITNDIGGTTGLNVSSFGFNNTSDYTQVYFITDGTDVIEAISVTGNNGTPVAGASALTTYMAGTYDVYVVNYNNTDAAANAAVSALTTLPTTVTEVTTAVATTYSSGACMVRAANAMTIEVCDPVCACSEGTTGLVQGLTAVPGGYNIATDYEQTYLLVDNAGVILDIQATANFTGLVAGTYQIYNLNYNTTTGESPLADGATWTAIDLGTTTIANLSTTPGLADACFDLVAPSGTITVDACPTVTIVSNNSAICDTEDAEFVVNGTNGTTLTYTITGQTGNQTLALTGVDQTITAAGATADVILTFVSIADAGTPICTINLTNTATVTVNNPPATNAITGSNAVCESSLDEAYSVTNNAGHTYAWSISGGGTLDATTGNSITVDWGTTAGTYTLTVIETETATGCNTTNTLDVTITALPTATTVTTTAEVCNVASETGNDEGQEDLDALVTAGDMTGTWTIVSGNTGGTATITGTMAGMDVVFDAGAEDGPFVLRYTVTATTPCTDLTYDVTVTRIDCDVCSPNVGITRQN